ncbi:MAG TPA: XdhC family protein [Anaeromyxobacteraceae bacterium]|nr:XdhC family protein [Anaeromyxobacteraceae bacterium]
MKSETLATLLEAVRAKRTVVLATPLATGEGYLVEPFGDRGAVEAEVHRAAAEAAASDRSGLVDTLAGKVFLRVFNPPVSVVIVGAVHIAQALAPMVRLAGYDVVVVDPRRAFAAEERFPGVPLLTEWPDEALGKIGLGRRSAVVTMTHDPKIDDPALAAALRSEAFYVGALGSKKTQAARRERLAGLGFTDGDLSRIHGPVGLSIGASSTGEIAVAILSQLVGCLRQPSGPRTGA